jgi:hypothetical protein
MVSPLTALRMVLARTFEALTPAERHRLYAEVLDRSPLAERIAVALHGYSFDPAVGDPEDGETARETSAREFTRRRIAAWRGGEARGEEEGGHAEKRQGRRQEVLTPRSRARVTPRSAAA